MGFSGKEMFAMAAGALLFGLIGGLIAGDLGARSEVCRASCGETRDAEFVGYVCYCAEKPAFKPMVPQTEESK